MAYSNLKNQIFGQLSSVLTEDDSIKIINKDFEFINNYDREYYIDKTSTIRLTIDKNQNYFQVTPKIKYYATINSLVVELKFSSHNYYKNFAIRSNLNHNSKYKNGIDLLFGI